MEAGADDSPRLWPILRGLPRRGGEHLGMTMEIFSFINIKFFGFVGFVGTVIHAPKTSLILLASCSMRVRFEAILQRTERELAGPGPRNGRQAGGRWSAGRRCAL